MEINVYEPHYYANPKFPIIFHYDTVRRGVGVYPHWHENMEFLYLVRGRLRVDINTETVYASSGEIVVIPTGAIHLISSETETAEYHCLIVDRDFCERYGYDLDEIFFDRVVCDEALNAEYDHIIEAFSAQKEYYQPEILSFVLSFLVRLARSHSVLPPAAENNAQSGQLAMVKKTFLYIEKNYQKELTTDILAENVGFNKYYFCHVFKKITAMTPVAYINYIRCRKARELLASGRANAGEAAAQCGFENLSYFSKTYKNYIGELPSETMSR